MKKTILFAAVLAALSFVSCQKDKEADIVAPAQDININITVADFDAPEANGTMHAPAAIKTGWTNGDKINIWFDEVPKGAATPDLVLTYNGSAWNASSLNNTPNASGVMHVVYEGYNDWSKYRHTNNYLYCKTEQYIRDWDSEGSGYAHATPLTVVKNNISYTYASNTLTASISGWDVLSKIQIVVTGLTPSEANNYALGATNLQDMGCVYVDGANGFSQSGYGMGTKSLGVSNEDGVAFYFSALNGAGSPTDITFELIDNTGSKKHYAVTNKTINYGGVVGIKLAYSSFN